MGSFVCRSMNYSNVLTTDVISLTLLEDYIFAFQMFWRWLGVSVFSFNFFPGMNNSISISPLVMFCFREILDVYKISIYWYIIFIVSFHLTLELFNGLYQLFFPPRRFLNKFFKFPQKGHDLTMPLQPLYFGHFVGSQAMEFIIIIYSPFDHPMLKYISQDSLL